MKRSILMLSAAALAALLPIQPPHVAAAQAQVGAEADARAELPDTPAGHRAAEMLDLANGGDEATTRAYVKNSFAPSFRDAFPIEEHLQVHAQMREESGGFDVVDVRESEPNSIVMEVKAHRTGERAILRIETEGEPPHRIEMIRMRPVQPGDAVEEPTVPGHAVDDEELRATLGDYLARIAAADAFSGAMLVARAGEPIFEGTYGEASKSYGVPNRADTKFNLGSMNKMFTAVSIAQLAEKGTLSYDDAIGKWLGPEWVRPEVGEKVTIRHLLTHTSGLGSFFNDEFLRSSRGLYRDLDDWQSLVRQDSLAFEPGTRWSYSNNGFHLLGVIVEKASGQTYYDYVREHVYEPAGMPNTDAFEVDAVVPNLAQGYERVVTGEGTSYRSNIFEHVAKGGPAGGGYSTAPDLLAFANALLGGRLVRPETLALITSAKPDAASPDYGYGFQQWDGGRVFGHTGGFPGISAGLMIDRESGDVVVMLSNYGRSGMPAADLARELLATGR
ncbi:MAG TPA: serine hydrolase [Gemmatimonadota bacterium]|nr:serine hydrolase [Gemmatimonadota bacterium]